MTLKDGKTKVLQKIHTSLKIDLIEIIFVLEALKGLLSSFYFLI